MKKILSLIIIILFLNINISSAAKWEYLFDTEGGSYYVETSSIFCDTNNNNEIVFHAFLKNIYTEKGRKRLIDQWYSKYGWIPEDADKIYYSVFLEYFKISNGVKYFAVDAETVIKTDGTPVYELSYRRNFHRWKVIMPGAISDDLFNAIYERLK